MNRFFVFGTIAIGLVMFSSCRMNQNQVPYQSTVLSPYSTELGLSLIPEWVNPNWFNVETYAKLETGMEDLQMYFGTGKQDDMTAYWLKIEYLSETPFLLMNMKKDESLNICIDTIKYKFKGDSAMIAFEVKHHILTNEIQYVWLEENNERSEKAVIISVDHPLKIGKNVPTLTVEQLNGEKLSFNDLIGKTIVINWWHTTCAPCIAEMPGFNKLVEQYPEIVFIAIAHNKKEDVIRFLKSRDFNYIQTLANDEAVKIFEESYPVSIIVNPAGKICYYSRGGHTNKYLELEKILKGL
jgi:thiol-disulfide isomerase/thioredoxin